MSLSPSWVYAHQEQCDCIPHTRHLRSGRGEARPLQPCSGQGRLKAMATRRCISYSSHCGDKIPDEATLGGRKGQSELMVAGYSAPRWEGMVAEVCLVTWHQQSGSRVAKAGLQLLLSFSFSLAQPRGQCYPRLWTVFPPQ